MKNKLSRSNFHNTDFEKEFSEWLQGQEDGTLDSKDIEVDDYPIICSNRPIGRYQAVLDGDGIVRFASTNARKIWMEEDFKKVMFKEQCVFDIFKFLFPVATAQLTKQFRLVTDGSFKNTETVIDLRNDRLEANHPFNTVFYSHMRSLSHSIATDLYRGAICKSLLHKPSDSWVDHAELHDEVKGWALDVVKTLEGAEGWVLWEWTVAAPLETKLWIDKPRKTALKTVQKHFPEAEAIVQ
tara:strand:+ start:2103 stop:2822 length:720 start_codon:yes stop_codon:yes gene_type:complete